MSVSRQRQLCLAILGVSGAALLGDRLFFSPTDAAAGPPSTEEYAIEAGATGPAGGSVDELQQLAARRAVVSVGQRLENFASKQSLNPETLPDPFLPDWVKPVDEKPGDRGLSLPTNIDPAQFARDYQLTAVMGSGPGQYAVVSGRLLRRGQRLGQFVLIQIDERTARFQSPDGRTVDLSVKMDGPIRNSNPDDQP